MEKKRIIKGIILFILYILIFAFLIRYVADNSDLINRIMSASPFYVLMGIICSVISIILTGLMDVTCAKVYGVRIGCAESVGLTYVASAVNLILPLQMGSVIKAVYLKKMLSLAYLKYVSIISGTAVINLMVTIMQIIICMIIVSIRISIETAYIFLFIGILIALLICFLLMIKKQEQIIRILPFKRISTPIMKSFFALISDRRAVVLVTANLFFSSILGGLRFLSIFKMLDFDGSIMDGLLYYGLYNASSLVPILPGNIGISELFVGIMNKVFGSDFDIGVTTVLVNRVYYYIVAITGACIAALPLWIKYNKKRRYRKEKAGVIK